MEEMLKNAYELSQSSKFFVEIGEEEIRELTYLELGNYLIANNTDIQSVHIKLKPSV